MKQALKQSFAHLLRTTLPAGFLLTLVVYTLRWFLFFNTSWSFAEEANLFLLILVASCCTTYLVLFVKNSIRIGVQRRW